jgi:hypothetical protein
MPPRLAGRVEAIERDFSGTVALWCHDLTARLTFGLRSAQRFDPASTIKLFILRQLYRQQDAGLLRLDETLTLGRYDLVPGSGVLKDLTPARVSLTLRDLATLMITVSDNVATDLLIGRVGVKAVNRGTREAGFPDTYLQGKLVKGRTRLSHTTSRDLGTLMTQIARRQAVSREASNAMLTSCDASSPTSSWAASFPTPEKSWSRTGSPGGSPPKAAPSQVTVTTWRWSRVTATATSWRSSRAAPEICASGPTTRAPSPSPISRSPSTRRSLHEQFEPRPDARRRTQSPRSGRGGRLPHPRPAAR